MPAWYGEVGLWLGVYVALGFGARWVIERIEHRLSKGDR